MTGTRKQFRYPDERLFFWVAFTPTALIVVVVILFPILFTLVLAFFSKNIIAGPYTYTGFSNFIRLFKDPAFLLSFKNSLFFSFGSTIIATVFGLLAALVLNEKFVGRGFLRSIVIFPYIVPPIVVIYIFRFLFNSRGFINKILNNIGIIEEFIPWLGDSRTAMITSIFIAAWMWFPFAAVNILAGLQNISYNLYEASELDGASVIQRFRFITLPMAMPVIMIVVLIRLIWAIRNFDTIFLLTGGGPGESTYVLPILIYNAAFSAYQIGYASAVATTLFLFLVIFALIYFKFSNTENF